MEDPAESCDTTLSELRKIIEDLKTQQADKFDKLKSSMDSVLEQNREINNSMKYLSDKYDDLLNNMNKLQQENKQHISQIKSLEAKLEHVDKKWRATSIELRNIPRSESESKESLVEITKLLGSVIKVPIQDSYIRDVFRLNIKDKPDGPIVVDFNSALQKENFIKASRNYNRENVLGKRLSTANLKIKGDSKPIFIGESLTTKTKHLYYMARTFAKNNNFNSCYTSYGKVYLRRNPNESRILIDSEEMLENLRRKI